MCIIAYKPLNVAFPEEKILQNCFENNSDGAGFMYSYQGEVHIKKGYETFKGFMNALNASRAITGDKVPYVMHFRIATQGFDKCMTHPFPLSSDMKNLKKLKYNCNIGVAHNGILDLTSDGSKEYSDTMKFITDYLTLIIRNFSWYKDERTKLLIERLIDGSRLCILDKKGHGEILGKGWVENKGVFYSNSSYSYKKTYTQPWDITYDDGYALRNRWGVPYKSSFGDVEADDIDAPDFEDFYDYYSNCFNPKTREYDFDEDYCPVTLDDDDSYCMCCSNAKNCAYYKSCFKDYD